MRSRIILLFLIFTLVTCYNTGNETVSLLFARRSINHNYPDDGGIAKELIQSKLLETGTDINFSIKNISSDKYITILTQDLMMGDAPQAFDVTKEECRELEKDGFLQPLESYLPKMPHYAELVRAEDLEEFTINGHLYAFPKVFRKEFFNGPYTMGWGIRKDWLNNLGLSMPLTLIELEEVMRAFTEDDPDGNGINDTVGLSLDNNYSMLWGAYGLPFLGVEKGWIKIDGRIINMTTMEEARELLLLLSKWYGAGYLDLERCFSGAVPVLSSGKPGMTIIPVWQLGNVRAEYLKRGIADSVQIMPPVAGPYGDSGYPVEPYNGVAFAISNRSSDKEIEAMIRFLDWSVNGEEDGGVMTVTYGIEGVHYDYFPEENRIQVINYGQAIRDGFSNPIRFIPVVDRRWIRSEELLNDISILNEPGNFMIYKESACPDDCEEFSYFLDYLWPKVSIGIITGELDISEWDRYSENFKKAIP